MGFSLQIYCRNKIIRMKYWSFYSFVVAMFLISCDGGQVFEENKSISGESWHVDSLVVFEPEITDTLGSVNVYINIRNGGDYMYSNLFMLVNTIFPNGKTITDTVECVLSGKNGWYGSGLGGIWSHQILYKRNVRFPLMGSYRIEFEQAQRYGEKAYILELPNILDVGLRIEKFSN